MYDKDSGIYKLLELYIPLYAKNSTWIIAFFISFGLTIMISQGNILIVFIQNVVKLGLYIFPPIFALSLTSVAFLLGLYDRDTLKKIRLYKIKIPNGNEISLYHKTVLSFMFFLLLIGITLVVFWTSNIMFEINYIVIFINNNKYLLLFLIFLYNFLSLLVLLTALDIVSSLYSFFRLQIYLIEQLDTKDKTK